MQPNKKIPYTDPALDISGQVMLLMQKGILINDPTSIQHWLAHNGYFRFKNYSSAFIDYNNGGYTYNTTFEKIRDLHLFDRKLRMTVFDGLETIEVSVKAHISNTMSSAHGPHWYLDSNHFLPAEKHKRGRSVFNHKKFLLHVEQSMTNHFDPLFRLYQNTYNPIYPPSWMLMEILTFGTVSRLFENLRPSTEKIQICKAFGLTKKLLVSWLHSFNALRNRCAHHNKLVYAKVNFAPLIPQKESRKFLAAADKVNPTSLYAVLACIQYMLDICNNNSSFKYDLLRLLQKFPDVSSNKLGFTPNWQAEKIWAPAI